MDLFSEQNVVDGLLGGTATDTASIVKPLAQNTTNFAPPDELSLVENGTLRGSVRNVTFQPNSQSSGLRSNHISGSCRIGYDPAVTRAYGLREVPIAKILLVGDDIEFLCSLKINLRADDHIVEVVHDGSHALEYMQAEQFDVIFLGSLTSAPNELDVLRTYRVEGGASAIIMFGSKDAVSGAETGLERGADDYIESPLSIDCIKSHMYGLLRLPLTTVDRVPQKQDIILDPILHTVTKGGVAIHLQPIDFALLEFFIKHPAQIFSKQVLLARVWGNNQKATNDGLRMAISRLRKALDDPFRIRPSIIETVSRVGYRLRA